MKNINRRPFSCVLSGLPFVAILQLLFLPQLTNAINLVHVDIGKTGQTEPYDTIYMGSEFEFRIHVENDVNWAGFTMGYEIWSDDGVTWEYLDHPDGLWAPDPYPYCFVIVPGSRMTPWYNVFDLGGPLTQRRSFDGNSPDSFFIAGMRMFGTGILPGDLEHMISAHLKITGPWSPGEVKEICIRHIDMPSGGDFAYFVDGQGFVPDVTTPTCFPISVICGDANADMAVNLGDAGFIINYIFDEGSLAPAPIQLGDGNADGSCNLGDASYLINYIFYEGPAPVCP